MYLLMSIHPQHVENILSGRKIYEYRKISPRKDVDKILIYSTSPVKKVVGEAEVENIIEEEKEKVWKLTQKFSGINKEFFDKYYNARTHAVAFKLGKVTKYDQPKNLTDIGVQRAPQSYMYIK